MMNLNEMMDCIDLKKEEIAKAVSLAFANGSKIRVEEYYPLCLKKINESKVFIFKSSNHTRKIHDNGINDILDKMSVFLGYSASDRFYRRVSSYPIESFEVAKDSSFSLDSAYYSCRDIFYLLGVTYQNFVDMYDRLGEDKTIEFIKLAMELRSRNKLREVKQMFFSLSDACGFFKGSNKISKLVDKCNIKSIDELLSLHTEISSCFIDVSKLEKQEIEIIEENKNKLVNRFGSKNIVKNHIKMNRLRKDIELIYNNEIIKACLNNSNLNEFFEKHNLSFTGKNLKVVMSLYFHMNGSLGFNTRVNFEEGRQTVSIIKDTTMWRGINTQNQAIIHELIHSIEEFRNDSNQYPFNTRCRYLNEAMTQCLTLLAIRHLGSDVIGEGARGRNFNCAYYSMFEALDILRKSEIWNDLLYCKLYNDYSMMIERLGMDAIKISNIFDEIYSLKNSKFDVRDKRNKELINKLREIIDKIEKEDSRYHKKAKVNK